jgi:asparagine synthase (glutamine-hydrolysing)
MCGIVGFVGKGYREKTKKGASLIAYRGPDDSGFWFNDAFMVGFGHRRLTVTGLDKDSSQPFLSKCGLISLVFNGEIYNYKSLRRDLIKKGWSFKSESDTEVVLVSYLQWGVNAFQLFDGMWSLALCDLRKKGNERIVLCRDRVGEKPLYYSTSNGFSFASEVKALHSRKHYDFDALNYYLAYGYSPPESSVFKGVKKVLPGCILDFNLKTKKVSSSRYYSPERGGALFKGESVAELADEGWDIFNKSVSLRLDSDSPVGVFLSGGLDSSLVVAAASLSTSRLRTFTIGFPGSDRDESSNATALASHYGTDHMVLPIEHNLASVAEKVFKLLDEPIGDASIIPTYIVSELARQHVTVALGGDGGDELFGGYRHHLTCQQAITSPFNSAKLGKVMGFIGGVMPVGKKGRSWLISQQYDRYASALKTSYFDLPLRKSLLRDEVQEQLLKDIHFPELDAYEMFADSGDLEAVLRNDFTHYLPDNILYKVDRASMYNSLEVRSPYLAKDLLSFVFSKLPPELKCDTVSTRKIQRIWAEKYIPNYSSRAAKQGFSIDIKSLLTSLDVESRLESLDYSVFSKVEVDKLLLGLKNGRSNESKIFALLTLAATNQ